MGKGDRKSFRGKLFRGSFGKYRSRKKKKKKNSIRYSQVIICDTNIFYGIGDGSIDLSKINSKSKLGVSQINLQELTITYTILNNEALVRNAIRSSFRYHQIERFEPPLIYLKQLSDKSYYYDTKREQSQFLEFTSKIANGYSIDKDKKVKFTSVCKQREDDLKTAAAFFNNEAAKIKPKIKDKKRHRLEDPTKLNRSLINLFVTSITKDKGISTSFKWEKIELFENALREFLFELETGAKKVTPNDWNDLFQLIYVQPGEKYWTKEKYWIQLIKKAGMQKYLYEK